MQYPAYRGRTGICEGSDPAGHIVRQPYRKRGLVAARVNDLLVKFKWWPTLIGRLIVHRPEAAPAEALLDLDALARFDIEKRSCREGEGRVGVDNQAQMFRCAGGVEHERGKRRMYLLLPVRVVAYIAPVEIWDEVEHPRAPILYWIDRMHERSDADRERIGWLGGGVDEIFALRHFAEALAVELDAALSKELSGKVIIEKACFAYRNALHADGGESVVQALLQAGK